MQPTTMTMSTTQLETRMGTRISRSVMLGNDERLGCDEVASTEATSAKGPRVCERPPLPTLATRHTFVASVIA